MSQRTLSKSSSAPVVCRAGFAKHLARVERRAHEAKEKSRGFQRQGATLIGKGSQKPHVAMAAAGGSQQEFQRLLQSEGFRQRFSPRTQSAASFVGKLAADDKDATQGWNLLVQHDVAKQKQAEQEKQRAAALKEKEVSFVQQRQAAKKVDVFTKARQASRENWYNKFQQDNAQMKKEHEEFLQKKADAKHELNCLYQVQVDEARKRRLENQEREANLDRVNAIAARERARLREEKDEKLRAEQRQDMKECSKAATLAIEERRQKKLLEREEDRKLMEFANAREEAEAERRRREEEERLEKVKKRLALFEQSQGGSVAELMKKQALEDERHAEKHRKEDDAKAEARNLEKKRVREELQKQCNESVERMLADKAAAAKHLRHEEDMYAEDVFRRDAKARADESTKKEMQRRLAHQNAEALQEQIQMQKQVASSKKAERMSSREREINRSGLELAKGSLKGIFHQRRQVSKSWPNGPVGLPG